MAADDAPFVPQTFASELAAALREDRISQKELARRLAGQGADANRVESARRQIGKWLSGKHDPEEVSARRVAAALGRPEGEFLHVLQRRRRGIAPRPTPREEIVGLREELGELRRQMEGLAEDVRLLREARARRSGDAPRDPSTHELPAG